MIELFRIGFLQVTLIDLVDIAIVAALFYWLYKALKNTVAVQILIGLVLVLLVSVITESLNIKSFNWILRTISDIWLVAFIILFQPELRRVLLLLTRSRLFRLFMRTNISETIDEVIEAAEEMAAKHIGALIVFTRARNVKMTIDTGIPIQAVVSREILLSIFNPRSPLHDGAVIIENQTVIAARCVLPLSNVTKYENKNLGTRHRAGLGISEQADVVVLIVSEETGGISLAHDGELTLNVALNELPYVLQGKLSEEKISSIS